MSNRLRSRIAAIAAVVCLMALWLRSESANAAGESYGGSQDDLQLSVNYRWAGGTVGGYYPIRISLQNRGPSRTLEFFFRPTAGNRLPVVTRRIAIDQNASARFTLLIPLAGEGDNGQLFVFHNGRSLERLEHRISLPGVDYENARPGLLAISETTVDQQSLEDAVTSLIRVSGHGHGHHHGSVTTNNETVDPASLPDTWLGYSCLDLVSIPLGALERISDEQRAALLNWTQTGGTLLVHSVGVSAGDSKELGKVLGTDTDSSRSPWKDADVGQRNGITVISVDEHGNEESHSESEPTFTWNNSESPFQIRDLGFGRVISFVDNPFPGNAQDWGWLLKNFSFQQLRQGKRFGTAGRLGNEEFLDFLIPGIRSVPLLAFLIFISLFAFVIGPLNYFVLSRKNRLNFLVVTIPAIAFVTSSILFGYSVLAHGFSVKSRVRSLTMIDQGTQTAVSSTRLALYAGLSPSAGLSFSPATAVVPIRPDGQKFESARTDWTESQTLESGWLRSRTRTQFLTMNVRPERGRLNVTSPNSDRLNVTNGLEWDLEALILTDDEGRPFYGSNLAAGGATELRPATEKEHEQFAELFLRSAPGIPEELKNRNDAMELNMGPTYRYYWGNVEEFRVSEGQMERRISAIRQDVMSGNPLPPNTYFAVVPDAPSIEFGTEVDVIDGWHLIVGTY